MIVLSLPLKIYYDHIIFRSKYIEDALNIRLTASQFSIN